MNQSKTSFLLGGCCFFTAPMYTEHLQATKCENQVNKRLTFEPPAFIVTITIIKWAQYIKILSKLVFAWLPVLNNSGKEMVRRIWKTLLYNYGKTGSALSNHCERNSLISILHFLSATWNKCQNNHFEPNLVHWMHKDYYICPLSFTCICKIKKKSTIYQA